MILSDASDGPSAVVVLRHFDCDESPAAIISILQRDRVALIQNVSPDDADVAIAAVADGLSLFERLELQATFASIHNHRGNIGKYFMSVNERSEFQFIAPHSEGNATVCMQLAASYAYENTTDGGLTILHHTDSESAQWSVLREVVRKVDLCGRTLSEQEEMEAKVRYSISIPESIVSPSDEILAEIQPLIPGIRCFNVLAKPRRTRSVILNKEVYAYWASISGPDRDSTKEYAALLHRLGLLKEPAVYGDVAKLDGIENSNNTNLIKVWDSGAKFDDLFDSRLVLKLEAGELIIFNNLTWTHAATNWTPGSGDRNVVVAFA